MKAVGGMANRQIARDVRAAPSTIDRLLAGGWNWNATSAARIPEQSRRT